MGVDDLITVLINMRMKPNCNGKTSLITLSTTFPYIINLSKIMERIQSREIGQ